MTTGDRWVIGLLLIIASVLAAEFVGRTWIGSEWVHDRGSIYWMCTSDGHQLIKDTDTGGLVLGRDDAKCDAGG